MISRLTDNPRLASLVVAVLIFFVSAIVYGQYGSQGLLKRDDAIVLYIGQQMARGIPPYLSIFDHKGPLAPMIAAFGVSVATVSNFDDILTVRLIFLILSSLAVVGLYCLGSTLFRSQRIGILAALVFIGFQCFGSHAMSGPRAKTPMVLFEILSLLFMARKKWFWAGICGSLAFLAWQPTAIYPLAAIVLSLTQSGGARERARSVLAAISGTLIPTMIVSGYFLYRGAFYEFVDGLVLFNLTQLERPPFSLRSNIIMPLGGVYRGYTAMLLPLILGFLMIGAVYIWRIKLHGKNILRILSQDRFAGLLLSFPAPVIWSIVDFQRCPDFFVFLPYVALGFGWLLCIALQGLTTRAELGPAMQKTCFLALCATLVGSAAIDYRATANTELEDQRQWAQQVELEYGHDSKLVSVGVPEMLVLLHRKNPNPYAFIIRGIHNRIDAKTPGGFDGWLKGLERYDPDVIAFGPTGPSQIRTKVSNWLQAHYQETTVGNWTLFVKNDISD